jgi:hypothetical protein
MDNINENWSAQFENFKNLEFFEKLKTGRQTEKAE